MSRLLTSKKINFLNHPKQNILNLQHTIHSKPPQFSPTFQNFSSSNLSQPFFLTIPTCFRGPVGRRPVGPPAVAMDDVEEFLSGCPSVDAAAAQELRTSPREVQRQVLSRGSLSAWPVELSPWDGMVYLKNPQNR